jgi:23S rRNA (uridine2552-2'-O)-methyltransferase
MTKKRGGRPPDYYARKAKQEGLLARSAYKLEELDRKWRLIRPTDAVLDLGSSPGSWLQYALKRAPQGVVVGVDRHSPAPEVAGRVQVLVADVFELDPAALRRYAPSYDVVLSDLAPATSGDAFVDSQRSLRLAERATEIALALLRPGGRFVVKLFQGEDLPGFRASLAERFEEVRLFKPQSSRTESNEIYLVGLGRQGQAAGISDNR